MITTLLLLLERLFYRPQIVTSSGSRNHILTSYYHFLRIDFEALINIKTCKTCKNKALGNPVEERLNSLCCLVWKLKENCTVSTLCTILSIFLHMSGGRSDWARAGFGCDHWAWSPDTGVWFGDQLVDDRW